MTSVPSGASFKLVQPNDPQHLKLAFELVGLKEIVGSKHERKVVGFFAEAGHDWVKDDETAWCAAFAHAMLGRAGIKGTGSLAARSYLDWASATSKPQRGDIAVFKRGNSSWQGHVAFFLKEESGKVWVVGGNQGNAVSVTSYPKASLLGYRKVPGASRQPLVDPAPETPAEAAAFPQKGARDNAQVEQVQFRLRELGYSEVGAIDGDFGDATEAAILIFKRDNNLVPLNGRIDNQLLAALMKAQPRKLAESRVNATPKEVREQAPEVQASFLSKVWAGIGGLFMAGVGGVNWLVSSFTDARAAVKPIADLVGQVPLWGWAGLLALGFVSVWFMSRKAEQKGVEAYKAGERR